MAVQGKDVLSFTPFSSCRDGDSYIVNGHKWWTSGAPDPRCKISIFMGKTDPSAATHKQQSMILVPMDAPGVEILRPLNVYGYDDAPHGHAEVMYKVPWLLLSALLVAQHAAAANTGLVEEAVASHAGPYHDWHAYSWHTCGCCMAV